MTAEETYRSCIRSLPEIIKFHRKNDPAVMAATEMYARGYCSRDEMWAKLVDELVLQKNAANKKLMRLIENIPYPIDMETGVPLQPIPLPRA